MWTRRANRVDRKREWERGVQVASKLRENKYSIEAVEQFVTTCEQNGRVHVDLKILSHCNSGQKDRLFKTALQVWYLSSDWQRGYRWIDVQILLQDISYSSSVVEEFVTTCEQYEVIHVDREILSHCSSEQKDRLLKRALELCKGGGNHNERCNDVKSLLQASNYSSSSVEQFVAACEQYKGIHVDPEILSHCSSEQKDRLLKTAVKLWCLPYYGLRIGERWNDVKLLLQDSSDSSINAKQFVTACEQYGVLHVDGEMLSHCSSEQKDRLLKTAVKPCRGSEDRWNDVKVVLQDSNYSSSSVEQLVAACEQYEVIHVDPEILTHCSSEQKDRLLKTAVNLWRWTYALQSGDQWNDVKILLQDCNYSTSSIEHFVTACEQHVEIPFDGEILSHCSSEQKDRLLKTALQPCRGSEDRWNDVKIVLQDSNYSSSSVEQFVAACEQYEVIHVDDEILSHCSSEQKERLMKIEESKNRWEEVASLPRNSNYSSSSVEHFITTCQQYGKVHTDRETLSHFSSKQRDSLLKIAIKLCRCSEERWSEVKILLQDSNYSSSNVEQFVTDCEQYDVIPVDPEILSHCSSKQMVRLLKTAVKLCSSDRRRRERWSVVTSLLKASEYSKSIVEQFVAACDYYNVINVDHNLLSHCSSEQKVLLLKIALHLCSWYRWNEERWTEVTTLLQASNYSSSSVEQFVAACEQHQVIHVDHELLSHCSSQQKDRLLKIALNVNSWYRWNEERWTEVTILLQASKFSSSSVEQFVAACEQYVVIHVDREILSYCSLEQWKRLFETAMKTKRFEEVNVLLKYRGYSSSLVEQFITACEHYDVIHADRDILSHCSSEQKDRLLEIAVRKERWEEVTFLLQASNYISSSVEQFVTACDEYVVIHVDHKILSHCSTQQLNRLLTVATTLKRWNVVGTLCKVGGSHDKRLFVITQACQTAAYKDFEAYLLPHVDGDFLSPCTTAQLDTLLTTATTRSLWGMVHKVLKAGGSHEKHLWVIEQACRTADHKTIEDCILPHVDLLSQCRGLTYATVMIIMNIAFGMQLLMSPLPSAEQQRRWNVIRRASLSQLWEQVRRHLFRKAVYQGQWRIVKKWADHTLYDDERWWALEETYKHKQWDVMLQLAMQGLTEIELMRVRYRLAKYADWGVVLRMIGRGVDVTEVREVLESTVISRKTKTTTDRATQKALALRWRQLRQLEEKLTRASARPLKLPSTTLQWRTVLFHLHRHPGTASVPSRSQPGKTFGGLLLQCAIEQRLWHVVMHLVTLGLDKHQLDSLLTDMMRRRQWGVCRVLLEQGVSVQSCLSALSVFMKMNQWTLVARVMEFIMDDALKRHIEQLALKKNMGSLVWQCVSSMFHNGICVGDAVRLQVMQRAIERREGSVVGECISTMQHYRLSLKEREELFQQAISRGVLQAVKPLVEEKDECETQHRDAAMLAAIEQRQWDVVDCCQLQGVDIDMKDVHGETPLNREVRKKDMNTVEWKVVEELLVRGANPNVLDKDSWSVLNRAIVAKQWDIVRLLIECLGDIHKPARSNERYERECKTPLQLLIDQRQGEIIHHTLIWCPDQAKGVNDEGETTLHAIALDKNPELLYNQIVRGVNPLTLTNNGHSVLLYATRNEHCPQRMAGKCIRLGFSTHQKELKEWERVDITEAVTRASLSDSAPEITSPFLLAVLRGMHVMAHMLYESGSSSYKELLHLDIVLHNISHHHTEEGRRFLKRMQPWYSHQHQQSYQAFMDILTTFLPYLEEMARTPRSLVSTCRLAISDCLTVRCRHERDLHDLDLTDRMKDYLLFSDLTDPDYQPSLYCSSNDTEINKRRDLEEWMKKIFNKVEMQLELEDVKI